MAPENGLSTLPPVVVSLSSSVTAADAAVWPVAVALIVAVPSTWSASSAALTVTATPVCQLAAVSATCAGATPMLASPVRARATFTVPPPAGAADRRTVSGALPPSSTVSEDGLSVTAGVPPPVTVKGTVPVVVLAAGEALSNARAWAV